MNRRTRIAPSPTGHPHVGTIYIALFNQAFAAKFSGKFILRIEDTDLKRSHEKYEKSLLDALTWTGITWDEGPDIGGSYGPYRQSERSHIYIKYAKKLLESGKAYKCFASPEELTEARRYHSGYNRRYRDLSPEELASLEGRPYTIRLKAPLSGEIVFNDKIKGKIRVKCSEIDDQVLLKSDGLPTYHLANVVDDHEMKITEVIRGDEWISSTPKHILLYDALALDKPNFWHLPLLLDRDKKKLSKRKHPTSLLYYRESGFLPEALVNFLTLMGYSFPDSREIYSIKDMLDSFDPSRIRRSGAIFDIERLRWLNKQYISKLSTEEFVSKLREWKFNDSFMKKLAGLVGSRISTLGEFIELIDFQFKEVISGDYHDEEQKILQIFLWELGALDSWKSTNFQEVSTRVSEILNVHVKKIIIPLLFKVITGKKSGPPLFQSMEILGEDLVKNRITKCIKLSKSVLASLHSCWIKESNV